MACANWKPMCEMKRERRSAFVRQLWITIFRPRAVATSVAPLLLWWLCWGAPDRTANWGKGIKFFLSQAEKQIPSHPPRLEAQPEISDASNQFQPVVIDILHMSGFRTLFTLWLGTVLRILPLQPKSLPLFHSQTEASSERRLELGRLPPRPDRKTSSGCPLEIPHDIDVWKFPYLKKARTL